MGHAPAINLKRSDLNALQKKAVWYLEGCGNSRAAISMAGGINRGTLDQVMSKDDVLLNVVDTVNLFRLASAAGFDEPSDWCSADWKRNRPILDADLNGSSDDEIVAAAREEGLARHHEERGEYLTAYNHFNQAAAFAARAALENLRLSGHPVVLDPAQKSLFA